MMNTELHDRFTSAERELEEKNAFVCETCGERRHERELHDRFSEAVGELAEKNPYICSSCGGNMIRATGRGDKSRTPAH